MARAWINHEHAEVDVLDRNGSLVLVEDQETGEVDWIDWRDVDADALEEWNHDNGPTGVGS